jgi:hypothetical protein
MPETSLNLSQVRRHFYALASAYSQIKYRGRNPAAAKPGPDANPILPAQSMPKAVRIREMKIKISQLDMQLAMMGNSSASDKKRVREVEAMLDVCRAKLEHLENTGS